MTAKPTATYLEAHLRYLRTEALPKCEGIPDEADREKSRAKIAEAIAKAESELALAIAAGRIGKKPEPSHQIIRVPPIRSKMVVVRGVGRPEGAKDKNPRVDDEDTVAEMLRIIDKLMVN